MECPTKLFYTQKAHEYKNSNSDNDFLASLADGGFQVGKMASLLYPDGIEVKSASNQLALKETTELLKLHDNIILFEPAFAFENLLCELIFS